MKRLIVGSLTRAPKIVERIAVLVEALHDPHRAAVDRGTEKTRHRRIALILKRQTQRRKLPFAISRETRIEIFKSQTLLLRG